MAFDYRAYLNQFLANYKVGTFTNDSVAKVTRTTETSDFYQLIGIHHLTGDENRGNHNLYMSVVDVSGKRINEKIEWGWEGQKPTEHVNPVVLDKPLNEPDGNISIGKGQIVWADVLGKNSDTISGVTTLLPDEGPFNTIGHHSYYCAWVWNEGTPVPPAPPPADCTELQHKYDKAIADLLAIKEIVKEY